MNSTEKRDSRISIFFAARSWRSARLLTSMMAFVLIIICRHSQPAGKLDYLRVIAEKDSARRMGDWHVTTMRST